MKEHKRILGSEALGTLHRRWKEGTFSEILSDWKWILSHTRRYRGAIIAYTILGVLSSTLGLVSAVASKYTIDIITGYDSSRLWFVILVMLLSALIGLLLRSLTSRISTQISLRVNNDIQAGVFDHLLSADWQALDAYSSGDLLNRLTGDAGTVAGNAIHWLPDLIVSAYSFFATLAVLVYYDWVMALLALASAPFLLLTSRRLLAKMRSHQQEVRKISSTLMAYETETLHNLDAIKGFGITKHYAAGMRTRQEDFRRASLDFNLFSIRTEALLTILGTAVQMGAFCYCLYLLWSGKILYGTMTLFLSQGAKLTSSFNALVKTVPSFLSASVSARRIRELFDLPEEPVLLNDIYSKETAAQGLSVRVEDVFFSYTPAQPVLQNASLWAAPGEIVALVGPSGGGKTTMIRLLLGLIHPSSGKVLLQSGDGAATQMHAGLRGCFSYVPQGNTLISGTIAENLKMVMPDADAAAMEHALLRAAPVLLLDEATSALDVATERRILRNLVQEYPNKTCIVTTHRPTVIGLCSRVYQISGGVLRELSQDEAQQLAMDF